MPNTIAIPKLNARVPNISLPTIDIEAAGAPYATLEAGVEKLGNALAARDALDEQARLAKAQADALNGAADDDLQQQQDGTIGPGFARAKDAWVQTLKPVFDNAKNNAGERAFAELRRQILLQAIHLEAAANAKLHQTKAAETLDELAAAARSDPARIGDVRDQMDELYGQLSADEQATFAARKAKVEESYLRGLIRQNPKYALEYLRSRKGDGQSLGIGEAQRDALEREAAVAAASEAASLDLARQNETIGALLDADRHIAAVHAGTGRASNVYRIVIGAHAADPELGRRLERRADDARAAARMQEERRTKVAEALANRSTLAWTMDRIASLDAHIDAVVAAAPPELAAKRMTRIAARAGHVPPKMRRQIQSDIHAGDPARRIAAAKALNRLERAGKGGGLIAWAPPDIRAFGRNFEALTAAGFGEHAALKRLDQAKARKPAQERARRHHFDTTLTATEIAAAIRQAFAHDKETADAAA